MWLENCTFPNDLFDHSPQPAPQKTEDPIVANLREKLMALLSRIRRGAEGVMHQER
jgi:hypothetical protein